MRGFLFVVLASGLFVGRCTGEETQDVAATAPQQPSAESAKVRVPAAVRAAAKPVRDMASARVREGMVRIPAGTNKGVDPDFGEYALAVSEPFHMDVTEVTWGKWKEVRDWAVERPDATPETQAFFKYDLADVGAGKADDHPVQRVSWYECVKWCNARSEKEGLIPCYTVGGVVLRKGEGMPDCSFTASGYRLPTVTEWEYAARGGLTGKRFPWGDEVSHGEANYFSWDGYAYDTSGTRGCHAKFKDAAYPYTGPVATFAANAFGLYDMAGNVWEWCWAPKGSSRCIRGGSWDADASGLRCGYRNVHDGPNDRGDYGGFRTVRRTGQ